MKTECGIHDCENMVEVPDIFKEHYATVYCDWECWDKRNDGRPSEPSETAQHTPGPWTVEHTDMGIAIYPICDAINATFSRENELMRIEAEANARLIAAAPDLLPACKALMGVTNYLSSGYREAYDLGIAAIDKATRKEGR